MRDRLEGLACEASRPGRVESGEAPVVGRKLGYRTGDLSLCGSPAAQLSLAFPFLLREFAPYTKEKYNCLILSLDWFFSPNRANFYKR